MHVMVTELRIPDKLQTSQELERTSVSGGGLPGAAVSAEDRGGGGVAIAASPSPRFYPRQTTNSGGGGGASVPSLVRQGITQPNEYEKSEICPNAGWLEGRCEHNEVRWVKLFCKRRGCPVCGKLRRRLIAWRVSYGLEVLGDGGWFVGTWAADVGKVEAVKNQNKFVRWLRKRLGYRVEYAAVWEVTKAGRLHLNLVLAPWAYIPQSELSAAWQRFGGGKVVWIERVGYGVGKEVAKLNEKLGNYMAKFEQAVEEGRGINYSRGWPKLPDNPMKRKGKISWRWVGNLTPEAAIFEGELKVGYWREVFPGEYAFSCGERCDCFDVMARSP